MLQDSTSNYVIQGSYEWIEQLNSMTKNQNILHNIASQHPYFGFGTDKTLKRLPNIETAENKFLKNIYELPYGLVTKENFHHNKYQLDTCGEPVCHKYNWMVPYTRSDKLLQ